MKEIQTNSIVYKRMRKIQGHKKLEKVSGGTQGFFSIQSNLLASVLRPTYWLQMLEYVVM